MTGDMKTPWGLGSSLVPWPSLDLGHSLGPWAVPWPSLPGAEPIPMQSFLAHSPSSCSHSEPILHPHGAISGPSHPNAASPRGLCGPLWGQIRSKRAPYLAVTKVFIRRDRAILDFVCRLRGVITHGGVKVTPRRAHQVMVFPTLWADNFPIRF